MSLGFYWMSLIGINTQNVIDKIIWYERIKYNDFKYFVFMSVRFLECDNFTRYQVFL